MSVTFATRSVDASVEAGGRVAFVFPGERAAVTGLGSAWQGEEAWKLAVQASEVTGEDVDALLTDTPVEDLRERALAPLAVFVVNMMVARALRAAGIEPGWCAGHAVGQYCALVAGGVISFEEGAWLVRERSRAAAACRKRENVAVALVGGISDDDVDAVCRGLDVDAWISSYMATDQVVVAGRRRAVEAAGEALAEAGAVSFTDCGSCRGYNTPLLRRAKASFSQTLAKVKFRDAGAVQTMSGTTGRGHRFGGDWRRLLAADLVSPIRWRQTVNRIVATGCGTVVKVGRNGYLAPSLADVAGDCTRLDVATPDDVALVVEWIAGEPRAEADFSERLDIREKLIVSPAQGRFRPVERPHMCTTEGEIVMPGEVIGTVAGQPVRSEFSGWLMGLLALPGQPVVNGEAVAWLRPL